MSNRVNVQVTKFTNLNPDGSEVGAESTYGVRLYDDYGQQYDNTFEKENLPSTPQEALKIVSELADDMYEYIIGCGGGFYFCDEYFEVDGEGNVVEK